MPQVPQACCAVIEWTDATRAGRNVNGRLRKKVGSGGLAGCQKRKAHQSWHVKSGRGGTRWYLPKSCVTEYRLPTLGHRRLRREGKDWHLEWDRTRQNRAGEHLLSNSVLAFGRARTFPPDLPARHKLICCYCSTITRSVRRSKASASSQSLYHISHIRRGT